MPMKSTSQPNASRVVGRYADKVVSQETKDPGTGLADEQEVANEHPA